MRQDGVEKWDQSGGRQYRVAKVQVECDVHVTDDTGINANVRLCSFEELEQQFVGRSVLVPSLAGFA